ncbi:MAG TPA: glutathione binding-like protein [Arenicellales bacterium]|nr:glutathione binding-like protein [Arenicellales bacterium]
MYDIYFWTTPNGYKLLLYAEEAGLDYTIKPVNIGRGEQFDPEFLKISPNNRIPALVDHEPTDGGEPLSVFESGAILLYWADKTGRFIPADPRARAKTLEWLFWQMAGLGPMAGQNHHFRNYAPDTIPYAIDRYINETARLYAVLDHQLEGRDYIADAYSIADMACYPWIRSYENQGLDINDFPNLKTWFERIQARPATQRAYDKGRSVNPSRATVDEESRQYLFGQGRHTVRRSA